MDPWSDDFLAWAYRKFLGVLAVDAGVARGDRVGRIFLGDGWITEADRGELRFFYGRNAGAAGVDRGGPCFVDGPDRVGDAPFGERGRPETKLDS